MTGSHVLVTALALHKPLSAQGLVSFCAAPVREGACACCAGFCAACAPDFTPLFEALLLQVLFELFDQLLEVVAVTKGIQVGVGVLGVSDVFGLLEPSGSTCLGQ